MPDKKTTKRLLHNGMDLENWLCKQVEKTGTVEGVYSGFEIVVTDEANFPWAPVMRGLLQSDHKVWIEERKGKIFIMTQASIE
jgi:hypothetical protein